MTLADIRAKAAARGFCVCLLPGERRYGVEKHLGGRVLADYADLAGVDRWLDRHPVIVRR